MQQCSFSICYPDPTCEMRLFCFPYAGGMSSIYRPWANALSGIEVCAANLPRNGSNGPGCSSIEELAGGITEAMLPLLDRRFALFGHSMGSLLAFEVASRVQLNYGFSPAHLFVSGHPAPQIARTKAPIHGLPEAEFIHELKLLNGTPEEVLNHAELMKLAIPMLRADFRMVETYRFTARPSLRCPITAFGGSEDREVHLDELEQWCSHTTGAFDLKVFPGDHFFIHSAKDQLLAELSHTLLEHSRAN